MTPRPGDGADPGSQQVPRESLRWVGLGATTIGVLTLVDVAGTLLQENGQFANIAGTLAIAPALTGIGGSRRQTTWVGALAFTMALVLAFADGVPLWAGLIRCSVVGVAGIVAAFVAGHRTAQIALLQDRREAARTLQIAMLSDLPSHPQLEMAARYLPAAAGDQVGGDWFDAVLDAQGATTLVVGDVTGHDVRAAAAMGQLRAMLRAYAVEGGSGPAQLLARLDAAVARLELDVLATVVVVQVAPNGTDLRWASAGHPLPVLVGSGQNPGVLETQDLLVGVVPDPERTEHSAELAVGATLLLYTDGLVERRGEDLRVGTQRLLAQVDDRREKPLEEFLDGVLLAMLDADHVDDVALLAIRRR